MEKLYIWAFDIAQLIRENPFGVFCYLYLFWGIIHIKDYSDTISMALNDPFLISKIGDRQWIIYLIYFLSISVLVLLSPVATIFYKIFHFFRRK